MTGVADPSQIETASLKEATLAFRKAHIARTLAQTGGNQTKAAEILGIQRTFLCRLIRDLGL